MIGLVDFMDCCEWCVCVCGVRGFDLVLGLGCGGLYDE